MPSLRGSGLRRCPAQVRLRGRAACARRGLRLRSSSSVPTSPVVVLAVRLTALSLLGLLGVSWRCRLLPHHDCAPGDLAPRPESATTCARFSNPSNPKRISNSRIPSCARSAHRSAPGAARRHERTAGDRGALRADPGRVTERAWRAADMTPSAGRVAVETPSRSELRAPGVASGGGRRRRPGRRRSGDDD